MSRDDESKRFESLRREVARAYGMTRQPYICLACGHRWQIEMEPGLSTDEQAVVARCPKCGREVTP